MSFLKRKNLTPKVLFSEFLRKEGITSRVAIREILLNNKFMLRDPYDDGNNYSRFVDDNNILEFNNPKMGIGTSTLDTGVFMPELGASGNTLRFSNLYLLNDKELKEDIRKSIIEIEKQEKVLAQEKKELNDKLDYLININSDFLSQKDYEQYKKDTVTNNLLAKETNIAVLKA